MGGGGGGGVANWSACLGWQGLPPPTLLCSAIIALPSPLTLDHQCGVNPVLTQLCFRTFAQTATADEHHQKQQQHVVSIDIGLLPVDQLKGLSCIFQITSLGELLNYSNVMHSLENSVGIISFFCNHQCVQNCARLSCHSL